MIRLLLDFPWRLKDALDPYSDAHRVIRDFEQFRSVMGLESVPFVAAEDASEFWIRLSSLSGGNRFRSVYRFLNHAVRDRVGVERAFPVHGPVLSESWQHALRDEMGDLSNWRTPQIVSFADREEDWANSVQNGEATIIGDLPPGNREARVTLFISSYEHDDLQQHRRDYERHRYASSDLDPWDVRHIYYPLGGGDHFSHCKLPRPDKLLGTPIERIDEELRRLRSESWPHNGRYWYIPPAAWQAAMVTKEQWRSGAFPEEATQNRRRNHQRGPIDYSDERIWLWDHDEGHWDVQLEDPRHKGEHKRINHEGTCLG